MRSIKHRKGVCKDLHRKQQRGGVWKSCSDTWEQSRKISHDYHATCSQIRSTQKQT